MLRTTIYGGPIKGGACMLHPVAGSIYRNVDHSKHTVFVMLSAQVFHRQHFDNGQQRHIPEAATSCLAYLAMPEASTAYTLRAPACTVTTCHHCNGAATETL